MEYTQEKESVYGEAKHRSVMALLMRGVAGAGYMVARTLGSVPVLADAVIEQLCAASSRAADREAPLGPRSHAEGERLSAAVWHTLWPVERCCLFTLPPSLPSVLIL